MLVLLATWLLRLLCLLCFRNFETLGPRDLELVAPGPLVAWALGSVGPGFFGLWDPGTSRPWDLGTLSFELLGPWLLGLLVLGGPGDLGPLCLRHLETLGPWDLELSALGSLVAWALVS